MAAGRDGGGSAVLQPDIYRAQSAAIRGKQTAVMMTHCSVTTLCLLTMLQCCSAAVLQCTSRLQQMPIARLQEEDFSIQNFNILSKPQSSLGLFVT